MAKKVLKKEEQKDIVGGACRPKFPCNVPSGPIRPQ